MPTHFDAGCYPIGDAFLASCLWVLEGRMSWAWLEGRVNAFLTGTILRGFAMETATTPRWYAARGANEQILLFGGARNFPLSYGVYRGYNRQDANATTDAANTFIAAAAAQLLPQVGNVIDFRNGPPLTIAGYSMGGAMSHLIHLFLKRGGSGVQISSRSFGSPPPTLGSVRAFLIDQDAFGYVAEDDPIPWLPGEQFDGAASSLFGASLQSQAPFDQRFIQVYGTRFLGNDLSEVDFVPNDLSLRPAPFNWLLTGWATGLMQTPSKAHSIANYFQLLWEASIPRPAPGVNAAEPVTDTAGPNILQQLPEMAEREEITFPRDIVRRALESYNALASVRFTGSKKQRTRCNRQIPFSLCKAPGGYFVSHYGTPLFPAKNRREGRRLAGSLNRIVQRAWVTPGIDVDGLLYRLAYELGSV